MNGSSADRLPTTAQTPATVPTLNQHQSSAAQSKSPTSPSSSCVPEATVTTANPPSNLKTLPTNATNHLPPSKSSSLKSTNQSTTLSGDSVGKPSLNRTNSHDRRQPIASTSTKTSKPVCTKITELSQMDCCSGNDAGSGCECSDDELILKFRDWRPTSVDRSMVADSIVTPNDANAMKLLTTFDSMGNNSHFAASSSTSCCSSTSTTAATKTGSNTLDTSNNKSDDLALESSDISSFEDLGAVGGLQTVNTNNLPSTSDTEKWQIINPAWNIDDTASSSSIVISDERNDSAHISYTTNLPNSITDELPQTNKNENQRQVQPESEQLQSQIEAGDRQETFHVHSTSEQQQPNRSTDLRTKLEKTFRSHQMHRKITRRQSDGIVYSASTSNGMSSEATNGGRSLIDLDDDGGGEAGSSTSEEDVSSHKRARKPCRKCGKTTKGNLKKYIARFRNQLETTTAFSETEIKLQLAAFLEFLENHSAFDSKDEESVANTELEQSPSQFVELEVFDDDDDDNDDEFDDDNGIHVYGNDDSTATSDHPPRQFFNLNSVEKK